MADDMENRADKPYKQILKSTFIMGGSSVIVTILGIVRNKFIALALGPTGMGLAGIYMNIATLVGTFSKLGINESGLRQIAESFGRGDHERIARTALVLRRIALLTGVAGSCILFILSSSVSRITFGTPDRTYDIAVLSITILFGAVSGGQIAIIQGTRRISDLAKLSIFGALLGTLLSIPIIYIFGENGIVYILLAVSAMSLLTSWWYSKKIMVPPVTLRWRDSFSEAKPLVRLGVALMLGLLMTAGAQYVLRVFVVRYEGLSAAGIYHAATTLSLTYVSVILNAMLTDFFPRLSASAHDDKECRTLINHQVEVGLLLVVPCVLVIMTFAPLIIIILYSSKFMQAIELLRWQMLGGVFRAVTWPMGYMIRAKGNGKLIFWTELYANGTHVGLAWLGITYFGLPGIGMSFFGKDILYFFLIYWIIRTNYNFALSRVTRDIFVILTLATGSVFLCSIFMAKELQLLVNVGITVAAGIYSLKTLISNTRINMTRGLLFKIKTRFGGS